MNKTKSNYVIKAYNADGIRVCTYDAKTEKKGLATMKLTQPKVQAAISRVATTPIANLSFEVVERKVLVAQVEEPDEPIVNESQVSDDSGDSSDEEQ